MRMRKAFISVICIMLPAAISLGNMIHYDDISLEDIVHVSTMILIVKKDSRFIIEKRILVRCKTSSKTCPDYIMTTHRFMVTDEMKNTTGRKLVGQTIEVHSANESTEMLVHELYYCEDRAKSPIYKRYNTECALDKENTVIIFLMERDDQIGYTAQQSYESLHRKDEIAAEIGK
jgi:hypothetical protein